jgi:outer membrane protein OmpA-like peptidoglycan-associated protein
MTTKRTIEATLLAVCTLGLGCTHAHTTSQLRAARGAVEQVRTGHAAELEPRESADAEYALMLAEAQDDGSMREAHYAYLADRRARRAMSDARRDQIEQGLALDTRDLEQAEVGIVTLDAELLFDTDRADLRADAREILAPIAEELVRSSEIAVIAGFTDSRGSTEHNRELSQRRADAVRAFLIETGVARASVVAEGLGESQPIASNATAEGRASNRRVEISIYPTATASTRRVTPIALASR